MVTCQHKMLLISKYIFQLIKSMGFISVIDQKIRENREIVCFENNVRIGMKWFLHP